MQYSYAHAHTRSQASSMQAKTLPSTHSFRHEWCMATSWSNSPHVRHAGTFACLHCIHRSVFVGWRLLCYTPAPCIILSDSLEQSWTHTSPFGLTLHARNFHWRSAHVEQVSMTKKNVSWGQKPFRSRSYPRTGMNDRHCNVSATKQCNELTACSHTAK